MGPTLVGISTAGSYQEIIIIRFIYKLVISKVISLTHYCLTGTFLPAVPKF